MTNLIFTDVGEVIAERELFLLDENPPLTQIRVLLGKPRPFPENNNSYYCPIQILGIGDQKVRYAGGVQALELAIQMIGYELHLKVNKTCGGRLRWASAKGVDLGFPLPAALMG
jgi:hypothetical protein